MLRAPQFFNRFVGEKRYIGISPRFCDVKYSKDDSGQIHRTVCFPDVPPIPGSPESYSLHNLLSAGVMLSPMPSYESPGLDDLSVMADVLKNEVISN